MEIDPPDTPVRVAMDDTKLRELRESMRTLGLIHPLAVTERDGRFVISDGHRRYTCASDLGWTEIRCEVYHPSELQSDAVMIAANRHREDPSAAEEALLFAEHVQRDGLDEAQACARFNVSPDYLGDRLRLLRGDKRVFDALLERRINFSVARELNKCEDEAHRRYLLSVAVDTGYSAAVVASHVREWRRNQVPQAQAETVTPGMESAPPAAEYRVECCICGGYRDPWAMVSVMIHIHELEAIREQLKRAALDVG